MSHINIDRLNGPDSEQLSRGAFLLMDDASNFPSEIQVLAPAVLITVICQLSGTDLVNVMGVAANWLADKRNNNDTRVKAMEYYVKRNILKQQV